MEYYPIKDTSQEVWWKIKVIGGMLSLEENSQQEESPNPLLADGGTGDIYELSVENGLFRLTSTTGTGQEIILRDTETNKEYKLVVSYGVLGIVQVGIEPTFQEVVFDSPVAREVILDSTVAKEIVFDSAVAREVIL